MSEGLREAMIRLAYREPHLRGDLLPLLTREAASEPVYGSVSFGGRWLIIWTTFTGGDSRLFDKRLSDAKQALYTAAMKTPRDLHVENFDIHGTRGGKIFVRMIVSGEPGTFDEATLNPRDLGLAGLKKPPRTP